jgi:UDP-N-acetyl-D-glucosamine dehydrogenase
LAEVDLALICTDHDSLDFRLLVERAPLIIDTRNACAQRGLSGPHIVKA